MVTRLVIEGSAGNLLADPPLRKGEFTVTILGITHQTSIKRPKEDKCPEESGQRANGKNKQRRSGE